MGTPLFQPRDFALYHSHVHHHVVHEALVNGHVLGHKGLQVVDGLVALLQTMLVDGGLTDDFRLEGVVAVLQQFPDETLPE